MAQSSTDVVETRASLREEMAGGDLGDDRLNARRDRLIDVLEQSPDTGFPAACASDGDVEALYRFLRNPRVSLRAVLEPHLAATQGPLSRPGRGARDSRHDGVFVCGGAGPGGAHPPGSAATGLLGPCGPGRVGRGPASPLGLGVRAAVCPEGRPRPSPQAPLARALSGSGQA